MGTPPQQIGGAKVICFTTIDKRHRPTGHCKQVVAGVLQGPAAGLVVCQYAGEDGYYLIGCDDAWQGITDTWHQTIEEAKAQAEFEYSGVSATWQKHA